MHMRPLVRRPQALLAPTLCRQARRSLASQAHTKVFAEGDVVLLRNRNRPDHPGILTKPLTPGRIFENHHGRIEDSDIIGKRVRDFLKVGRTEYRIQEPTLDEYVRMTPRIVTPIYHNDASVIVNLFDIHVSPAEPGAASEPPLEILEAGTGHGGLTLHLARAIHAANGPLPRSLRLDHAVHIDFDHPIEEVTYESTTIDHMAEHTLESWKKKRRAVVHTLDINRKHSNHAERIVSRFRRGMYANDIDFHVGDVSEWIHARFNEQAFREAVQEPRPFLSYVMLDLPSAERHMEIVAKALHMDGALAIFNPSVTQIADAVKKVKELGLPFALDRVVELRGTDTIREWDIKAVRPKATAQAASEAASSTSSNAENVEDSADEVNPENTENEPSLAEQAAEEVQTLAKAKAEEEERLRTNGEDWKYVCRPKTGLMVGVGGFLGLWRRIKTD